MCFNRARYIIAGIMVCTLGFGVSGCEYIDINQPSVGDAQRASRQVPAKVSSPTIHNTGTLRVGIITPNQQAPLCIEGTNTKLSGLDIDLGSALAYDMGLKVEFTSLKTIEEATSTGCDIVLGLDEDVDGTWSVVTDYAGTCVGFFGKDVQGSTSVDKMKSKTLGLQTGSTTQKAVDNSNLVMEEKGFSNLNEAFDALNTGSVDYVACDICPGAYLSKFYNNISFVGTLEAPEYMGIAVVNSNKAMQKAVDESMQDLTNNGVLDYIKTRWLGDVAKVSGQSKIDGISIQEKQPQANPGGQAGQTFGLDASQASAKDGQVVAGGNAATIN